MPSLIAVLAASVAGWIVGDVLQPYVGWGATIVLSLVCSIVVFYRTKTWLAGLRGR